MREDPKSSEWCPYVKRAMWRHTGRPWDDRGRDESDVVTDQETPRVTWSHKKRGSDKEGCSVVLSPRLKQPWEINTPPNPVSQPGETDSLSYCRLSWRCYPSHTGALSVFQSTLLIPPFRLWLTLLVFPFLHAHHQAWLLQDFAQGSSPSSGSN